MTVSNLVQYTPDIHCRLTKDLVWAGLLHRVGLLHRAGLPSTASREREGECYMQ